MEIEWKTHGKLIDLWVDSMEIMENSWENHGKLPRLGQSRLLLLCAGGFDAHRHHDYLCQKGNWRPSRLAYHIIIYIYIYILHIYIYIYVG